MKCKHCLAVFISMMIYSLNPLMSQELISNGGETFKNNDHSMEWSLGEIMIESYSTNYNLTQGFHQGAFIISSIEEVSEISNLDITAYPNPVVDHLNITIRPFEQSTFNIYNSLGQLVLTQNADSETTTIDLSQFTADGYVVQVLSQESKTIKAFKLTKINY